ncbi:hypothetical protein [Nocardia caishijiensis]|uniref:Adhesin domain-containing protein n=1 Tax=Nocardia caishijiensis TaxID=184756 RepID=A0ABQ6YSH0_9NOCA|nr:hypothetical protein [Nocardia caishijiensis]KAF0848725.1 hypothetical protein FNL39_101152 [Nocardia caishijiensis]
MYTFATTAPVTVSVDVLSAGVTVIASDRTDAVVTVAPSDAGKKGDVRAAEQTLVEFADGTLTVVTPKSWRTHSPFGGNPSIELTIEVPAGSHLTGTAGVGQLRGNGALGACDLSISLGDIVLECPQGPVTAKVAKGDIRIGEVTRGEIQVETSMGELEVGIRPGTAVQLETETAVGAVRNTIVPAAPNGESVRLHARNSVGDIIIRPAVPA